MAGADFDEGAHAVGVHRLNLLHEIDRPHDLIGECVARLYGRFRVLDAGGIGVDGHTALAERDASERFGERRARVGHERAVKRRRYLQNAAAYGALGEFALRPFDLLHRAGEDSLLGRIAIRDHQFAQIALVFVQETQHRLFVGLHRQHRAAIAAARAARHQATAQVR